MPIDPKPEWPNDLRKKTGKLPPLGQAYTPGEQYIIQQNHEAQSDRGLLVDAFNSLLHIVRLDHGHLVSVIGDVDNMKTVDKMRKVEQHDKQLVEEGKWFFPTKLVSICKFIGTWMGHFAKFIGASAVVWAVLKHLFGVHLPW